MIILEIIIININTSWRNRQYCSSVLFCIYSANHTYYICLFFQIHHTVIVIVIDDMNDICSKDIIYIEHIWREHIYQYFRSMRSYRTRYPLYETCQERYLWCWIRRILIVMISNSIIIYTTTININILINVFILFVWCYVLKIIDVDITWLSSLLTIATCVYPRFNRVQYLIQFNH